MAETMENHQPLDFSAPGWFPGKYRFRFIYGIHSFHLIAARTIPHFDILNIILFHTKRNVIGGTASSRSTIPCKFEHRESAHIS